MIYLPRNTDVRELVTTLQRVFGQYSNTRELRIEIEQIIYKDKTKALCIYTGGLAWISHRDVADYMFDHVYDVSIKKAKDKGYLFKLTKSLVELKGAGYFVEQFGLS